MLHPIHSYLSLSVRRKEKALWKLKRASDLTTSIALGHEPPQKCKCKYEPLIPLWLLASGQAGSLAVSVGDAPTPGGSPDKGMRGAAV